MERAADARGQESETDGEQDRVDTRRRSDTALVTAMRSGSPGAFGEFFQRFAPLLMAYARTLRVSPSECDERVTEFLDEMAMRLARPLVPVPRSLAAYLSSAFRMRARNTRRDRRCREQLQQEYSVDVSGGGERVLAATSSENAIRSSRGPGWEPPVLASAVERLALELERGLRDDDRQLLGWLGQRVPQREIAAWLGITHGALRVRVTRLRARLREASLRYAYRLDGADRAEFERFFHRLDGAAVDHAARPTRSPGPVPSPDTKEHDDE